MPEEQRALAAILDEIAGEAQASGDQPILDLVEETCDLLGFDEHCSPPARAAPASPSRAARGRRVAEPNDNKRRRDRAAQAIAAYDERDPCPGFRPVRVGDPENGEEAISELLCDLRHLADELGLSWARLGERADRYHAEEAPRHVVEVSAEGFQVLDTWTEALRADVWSSRELAQAACEELNGPSGELAGAA